jgi:hypothetical protein
MQTELMVIAEMLCMLAYLFSKEEGREMGSPGFPSPSVSSL